MRTTLQAPARFDFRRTVLSHGWCRLPPFRATPAGDRVQGVVTLPCGVTRRFELSESRGGPQLRSPGHLPAAERRQLVAAARRVLNLDLDLSPFHARARQIDGLGWIALVDGGRLMRAPTAFEDLVKLVLTTNCSWALTEKMTGALVALWGGCEPGSGERAFPTPAALAAAGPLALRRRARTGYRAPLLSRLARLVAAGHVDPEGWDADPRDAAQLREELLGLPGVGPYVADSVLKLLGRPSGLALDSWLRAKYARVYHEGRRVTDRTIGRRYARLGPFAGLGLWCDMTRDWFDGDGPTAAGEALS